MRVVNIKELKARLSSYLQEVDRGETLLVTHRGRVVAQLAPVALKAKATPALSDALAQLVALGARPPLRSRRPGDYRRIGPSPGLSTRQIDELLDWVRGEGG